MQKIDSRLKSILLLLGRSRDSIFSPRSTFVIDATENETENDAIALRCILIEFALHSSSASQAPFEDSALSLTITTRPTRKERFLRFFLFGKQSALVSIPSSPKNDPFKLQGWVHFTPLVISHWQAHKSLHTTTDSLAPYWRRPNNGPHWPFWNAPVPNGSSDIWTLCPPRRYTFFLKKPATVLQGVSLLRQTGPVNGYTMQFRVFNYDNSPSGIEDQNPDNDPLLCFQPTSEPHVFYT
ncbi:uncharacterized protein TNCV_4520061 [Trichonephila clavipes]|nr:uncharacterized protein TNCV_4520061 [Trichonephila clavipes]